MYTMFLLAITSARRSIYGTNPYFLPDARMTQALIDAPGRGVRVVVLLPGAIDNNIVRQASRSKFGELLKAGFEIYEYQAGLFHAKVMSVDGIWATIGSTNLDSRSFALNQELNAVVYHGSVVAQLEDVFAEDLNTRARSSWTSGAAGDSSASCWRSSPFRFASSSSAAEIAAAHENARYFACARLRRSIPCAARASAVSGTASVSGTTTAPKRLE